MLFVMSSVAQQTGTFTDVRDGKTYKTVTIGTQTWMAENLAYKADSGCFAYFYFDPDNDEVTEDEYKMEIEIYVEQYGYLYTWETAKKICPSGWHLPSDTEWTILTNYLGCDSIAGGKLKSISGWTESDVNVTNSSGFTALPGGSCDFLGTCSGARGEGFWWSSTEYKANWAAFDRNMEFNSIIVGRYHDIKDSGMSVRCVKD